MKKLFRKTRLTVTAMFVLSGCITFLLITVIWQNQQTRPAFQSLKSNSINSKKPLNSIFNSPLTANNLRLPLNITGNQSLTERKEENSRNEYLQSPIHFEPNLGQIDSSKVKFTAHGSGYSLFLTETGATFVLRRLRGKIGKKSENMDSQLHKLKTEEEAVIEMRLVDAAKLDNIEAAEQLNAKSNYFIGNDPNKWRTDVPNYGRVRFNEVYQGIDLEYYGNQKEIEYDFIVKAGAEPDKIKLHFDKAEKLSVNEEGELILKTKVGQIRQKKPIIYQEKGGKRLAVEGGYKVTGQEVSFWLGDYDSSKKLIIDPVLYTAEFIGGGDYDFADDISSINDSFTIKGGFPEVRIDNKGYVITGVTASSNFPSAVGSNAGNSDIFIRTFSQKFREDIGVTPRVLLESASYTTYLGGNGYDAGYGAEFDQNRNVWITGETASADFPTTSDGRQRTFGGGGGDAYLTKINSQGNQILYSTFHGGSGYDYGFDIGIQNYKDYTSEEVTTQGVWLTGGTSSTNFPTISSSASQQNYGGGSQDAFVTNVALNNGYIFNSTYLGGNGDDVGKAVSVDHYNFNKSVWITGSTSSTNFPTTNGAFQRIYGGGASDAFISRFFISSAPSLDKSTYLGGSGTDSGNGITFWSVTGSTSSTNFPTTAGAYQKNYGGGASDAFYTGMNYDLQSPFNSTYIGGGGDDFANSITEIGNDVFITGSTSSTNFPVTTDAAQSVKSGGKDAFITKLYFGSLRYSTFYGGSSDDSGNSIAPGMSDLAEDGILVVGDTLSNNFPVTQGAGQTIYGGGARDGFFIRTAEPTLVNINVNVIAGCADSTCSTRVRPTRIYARRVRDSKEFEAVSGKISVPSGDSYSVTAEGGQLADGRSVLWSSYSLNNVVSDQSLDFYVRTPSHPVIGRLVGLTSPDGVTITVSGGNIIGSETYTANFNQAGEVIYNIPSLSVSYSYQITPSRDKTVFTSPSNGVTPVILAPTTMDFSAVSCAYQLTPNPPQTFSANGGNGSVTVSTASECSWTAVSNNSDWLTITGTSATAVNFSVKVNPNTTTRTGTMTIAEQTYTVNQAGSNPVPVISGLSKTTATVGDGNFTLTINGSGFISSSEVKWGTTILSNRTIVSGSQIDVPISAALLQTAGIFQITVANSGSGTASANFTVNNPTPSISSLNPSSQTVGSGDFELIVNGSGFINGSVIRWNSQSKQTTFVSATQLKAQITAADLAAAGQIPVAVFNPEPGGGTSTAFNFIVGDCTYQISPLNAQITAAGGGGNFNVTANAGCSWRAAPSHSWIVINSPTNGNGSGNGNVAFAVQPNTGEARSGTISVGDRAFIIDQAAECTYQLDKTSADIPAASGGNTYNFNVATAAGCTWEATSNDSWITNVTSNTSTGAVTYKVQANTSSTGRDGTITVKNQVFTVRQQGAATSNRPALFDMDGDRKTDYAIFRQAAGEWWFVRSGDGTNGAFQFGNSTDKPVPADYTGDGKMDIAFWRPSTGEWYVLRSEDSSFFSFPFGAAGDIPAPADYDGDGKVDPAIFRPSNTTWYILKSSGGTTIQQFGSISDVPIPGDFDGDGKADLAIYRVPLGQWWYVRSSDGVSRAYQFGNSTDKPVPADYTGDGKTDVAFYRPATSEWYVLRSEDGSFYAGKFGAPGDVPVAGDYDGDGKADWAIWRQTDTNWYVFGSSSGITIYPFGAAGDKPLPTAFVP